MVYGEDDLLWLNADDSNVPGKDSDIKPRHEGDKAHGLSLQDEKRIGAYREEITDNDDDDDDYDDTDFDDTE